MLLKLMHGWLVVNLLTNFCLISKQLDGILDLMVKKARCVVIGGGTGSFSVLSGLRDHVSDISAIVSMADDGGSTGVLRDELGVLPPGDVRQCLVALSDASEELRQLFNFRFKKGSFEGHSFGNLFLSAVEKMTDNFDDAVRMAGDVLQIKGEVVPVTLSDVRLAVSWNDGTVIQGEGKIDVAKFAAEKGRPDRLYLEPNAQINPRADKALREADIIVIAPGDLYTTFGPLLVVDGVKEALAATNAKIVYISNLVIKPGHTDGLTVAGHAAEIERFAGGPVLDYVLYNTEVPEPDLSTKYASKGEVMVEADARELAQAHYESIGRELVAGGDDEPKKGNAWKGVPHSFIRHDPDAVCEAILELIK
jgi:uncharacterized cofD-like protein